jgi:hypothetical protein
VQKGGNARHSNTLGVYQLARDDIVGGDTQTDTGQRLVLQRLSGEFNPADLDGQLVPDLLRHSAGRTLTILVPELRCTS